VESSSIFAAAPSHFSKKGVDSPCHLASPSYVVSLGDVDARKVPSLDTVAIRVSDAGCTRTLSIVAVAFFRHHPMLGHQIIDLERFLIGHMTGRASGETKFLFFQSWSRNLRIARAVIPMVIKNDRWKTGLMPHRGHRAPWSRDR
jgi:hypothetical protein